MTQLQPKMKLRKSKPENGVYVFLGCLLVLVLASVGVLMYVLGSRGHIRW
jgi:hypothetical protein